MKKRNKKIILAVAILLFFAKPILAAEDPLLEFFKQCTGPNCGGESRTEEDRRNDSLLNGTSNGGSNGGISSGTSSGAKDGISNGGLSSGASNGGSNGGVSSGASNGSSNGGNSSNGRGTGVPGIDRNGKNLTNTGPAEDGILISLSLAVVITLGIKKLKLKT